MLKKFILILAIVPFLLVSPFGASAAQEKRAYPTDTEIESLNQELQKLVEQANEKLANGQESIEVSSENLKLVFKQEDIVNSTFKKSNQLDSKGLSANAIGSKSYQAYVANTTGYNFRHAVHGTFTWNGSYLSQVTADEDLSGIMYGKSATTKVTGVDGVIGKNAKIGKVTSKGVFTPLKWSPFPFYTTLVVDVYAPTKSYRIITAKIAN